MAKFPVDPRKDRVLKALAKLGFEVIREHSHIVLERRNPDGSKTPMTIPNHLNVRSGTLRAALNQSHVDRQSFLDVFEAL